MNIIVGSTALQYHKVPFREPKDLDVWTSGESYSLKGDIKTLPEKVLSLVPDKGGYATPDAIYTIKCSHLGWRNPMWSKHKADILYLKSVGCKLIPTLYKELIEFWKVELGDKGFLSLNKSKEEFFQDKVEYKYDHDWLHEMAAYPNQPMYTLCLKDGHQVAVDREKFDSLPFEQQVRMFREEVTVIAIERWVVFGKVGWFKAYSMALQKTITNLTKGWATDFIVLNLEHFTKPDYSYFEHVISILNSEENSYEQES